MSASTLTDQLADDLRKQIVDGTLSPGSSLPSEAQLGDQYDVSRVTVRRALDRLQQEGLIATQPGRGRTVRTRRTAVYEPQAENRPRRSRSMDRFMAAFTEEGRVPSQTIDVVIEKAEGIIAERLQVPVGTPVVARKRVRSLDGEPFNINDTYHHLDIAKDTTVMSPADIPEGSNTVIERLIGREIRTIDEFYIRMPTPEEARRLSLSSGTPVAVHYATGYTEDDKIVRVEYFVIPGDRHVIIYERDHPYNDDNL